MWDQLHWRHYKAIPSKPSEKVRKWLLLKRKVKDEYDDKIYDKLKTEHKPKPDSNFSDRQQWTQVQKAAYLARIQKAREDARYRNGWAYKEPPKEKPRKTKKGKRSARVDDGEEEEPIEDTPPTPKRPRKEAPVETLENTPLDDELGSRKLSSLPQDVIAGLQPHTLQMSLKEFMDGKKRDVFFSVGDSYDKIKEAIEDMNGEVKQRAELREYFCSQL